MMARGRFLFVLFLSLISSLTWGSSKKLPYFGQDDMTPFWSQDVKTLTPAQVKAFRAIDQNSKPLTEADFSGKISLVNFFFAACPGLCPTMMKSILQFQKKYPDANKNVTMYSFSVTPEDDSSEVLKRYSEKHHLNSKKWLLLTGDKQQMMKIGKEMFRADGSIGAQKSDDTFIHTKNIYLVDKSRYIRGIYDTGSSEAMALLAKDIETLKRE